MNSVAAQDQVWFVTGGGRGLGRGVVKAVIAAGGRVSTTVRSSTVAAEMQKSGDGRILASVADVTDPVSVRRAFARTVEEFGGIDVLINNAGYTYLSSVEEATDAEIRKQFEVNLFGAIDVTRAALPHLRGSAQAPMIILISSVAGVAAPPGYAFYAASKHAIEGFGAALAAELGTLGVRLTIVEPGAFRTDALGESLITSNEDATYEASVGEFRKVIENVNGQQPGDAEQFGRQMLRLAGEKSPPLKLALDPGATEPIRETLMNTLRELEDWSVRFATDPIPDE